MPALPVYVRACCDEHCCDISQVRARTRAKKISNTLTVLSSALEQDISLDPVVKIHYDCSCG